MNKKPHIFLKRGYWRCGIPFEKFPAYGDTPMNAWLAWFESVVL